MNFDKYENKLEYPKMIKLQCQNCGTTFNKKDNYCVLCGENVRAYYNNITEIYNKAKQEYNTETARLYNQFKQDALDDVGLLNHPKADDIFSFAWDHGHSSGYYNVYYWLQEISYLFKD